MKFNRLYLALAASGMLLGSATALADGDQPFHFTGQVGALYTDSDRNMRDNDVWWSLGFGYFFTDNFSLDLEYDTFKGTWNDYASVQPGVTYDKWGLKNYGLMARYYFTDWQLRPFVAGGLGHQLLATLQGDVFNDQKRIEEGCPRRNLTPFLNLKERRVLVLALGHLLLL